MTSPEDFHHSLFEAATDALLVATIRGALAAVLGITVHIDVDITETLCNNIVYAIRSADPTAIAHPSYQDYKILYDKFKEDTND